MIIKNKWLRYSLLFATFWLTSPAFSEPYEFSCPQSVYYCELPVSGNSGGSAKNTENIVYSGLVWEIFGEQKLIPQFVIGVRSLEVKDNNNVSGADASLRIKYQDKFGFDSIRLTYVGGSRDIMGNLGAGYSLSHGSWLGTAAIQGPYTRLSTDYTLSDSKFRYFGELITLDKPNKVFRKPSAAGGCESYTNLPVSYQLVDVDQNNQFIVEGGTGNVNPAYVANGQTCFAVYD